MQTSTYYLKDLLCQIELAWIFCCKIEGSLASLPDLLLLLFFDWKRHIDLLIDKKKYTPLSHYKRTEKQKEVQKEG